VFHSLQHWNATIFGLAKQWTPLMCAGLSMAGEPQIPFMSLSMCLSYLLGPYWGLKIAIPIYFSLGWAGAFLYAGLWFKSREQRMLAASLFIGNGGLIELRFFNALSKSAAGVSTRAWTGWLVLAFTFSVLAVSRREWDRRLRFGASPATAGVVP
jgi:hypothetical protein